MEGEIIIFGTIDVMMPGFRYVDDVDLEIEEYHRKICPLHR